MSTLNLLEKEAPTPSAAIDNNVSTIKKGRNKHSDETKTAVITAYAGNDRVAVIAERYKVSVPTVYQWVSSSSLIKRLNLEHLDFTPRTDRRGRPLGGGEIVDRPTYKTTRLEPTQRIEPITQTTKTRAHSDHKNIIAFPPSPQVSYKDEELDWGVIPHYCDNCRADIHEAVQSKIVAKQLRESLT